MPITGKTWAALMQMVAVCPTCDSTNLSFSDRASGAQWGQCHRCGHEWERKMGVRTYYAERDIEEQGAFYATHVQAMTREELHKKSDIAAELAHRDIQIKNLLDTLEAIANRSAAHSGDPAWLNAQQERTYHQARRALEAHWWA